MGSNVPLKRRVIFYYVVKFYILYLTISYVILFTIVLYVNITVFILYFTLFFFTILAMYCKNTNTLILPRCSYFYCCCCYYRYIIIMSSGFRGVSRTKRTKGQQKLYMFKMCFCWWTRFGWDFQWILIFLLAFLQNI